MSVNLNDFLGDHPWLLWLVLAALLAGARLMVPSGWLLRGSAVAVLVAAVAAVWPGAAGLQLLVAVALLAVDLVVVRRRRRPVAA